MKIYNILLLFCFALLLTSCLTEPPKIMYDDFLCVINSDGTGFQKFAYPNVHGAIWDMYVTKDGKLIFAADKYYITDPDSINLVPISDLLAIEQRRLTLSNDNKAYFCENGILVKYDLLTNTHFNLTDSNDGYLMNPFISSDDTIVTLQKKEFDTNGTLTLCYYSILDDSLHLVPQAGTATFNGIYNPIDQKLYHEQFNGLYKINLNGTDNIHILTYSYHSEQAFGLTFNNGYCLSIGSYGFLLLFDINSNNTTFTKEVDNHLARVCKSSNMVFFVSTGAIYYYDIDNQSVVKVPNTTGVEFAMTPTWNGEKTYYFARLRSNK